MSQIDYIIINRKWKNSAKNFIDITHLSVSHLIIVLYQ